MKFAKIFSITLLITILIIPTSIVKAETIQTGNSIPNNVGFSTWLWNTSEIVNNSEDIINFLVKKRVNTLYLQIDYNLDYMYYKNFIRKAAMNNIVVEALDGAPTWVSDDGGILQGRFFNWLSRYQKASSLNERFKGVHLDVEPYGNEEYATNQNKIISKYQDLLLRSKNACKKLNLNLGIDIPFWFNQIKYNTSYGNGNLAEWIFKNIKSVTIMAYRDIATGDNGINKIAEVEMNLCKKYNVKATIAVETGSLPDTTFVTFFEEGESYMYNELNRVYLNYNTNPSFNGFAVHYFDSWINMKP
ncbi:hypothetical protein [Clostridium cylindrosporum]|uniref:Amidase n=1 Tax=Clostridium cylindrosporum DSM 605 TaxID=1121307 RepID=A0A0J8DGG7_CLOCY|nr:hypothetical protein [Clostridium cylindrosporum]KMT23258.1 hypothetical protein CLCY_6c01390 [Clostridium cylindrosporum DSM 605]